MFTLLSSYWKYGASWHDLVTSEMGSSCVSTITWNIYVKLIKNEADSIISDIREQYGRPPGEWYTTWGVCLITMWSNTHHVHHSQDLGKSPGVLWAFSYETWTNHTPVQNLRNHKIKLWIYPNIHVYKIYIPSDHVFWTCWPLFPVTSPYVPYDIL